MRPCLSQSALASQTIMVYVTPVSRNGLLQSGTLGSLVQSGSRASTEIRKYERKLKQRKLLELWATLSDILSTRRIVVYCVIERIGQFPFIRLDRSLAFNTLMLSSITGPFPPTLHLLAHDMVTPSGHSEPSPRRILLAALVSFARASASSAATSL